MDVPVSCGSLLLMEVGAPVIPRSTRRCYRSSAQYECYNNIEFEEPLPSLDCQEVLEMISSAG